MFRVIIAGSRGFYDYKKLCEVCDFVLSKQKNIQIVSGTAAGADRLGERYAKEKNYQIAKFPADWDQFGKKSGFIRNEIMAQNADALIAFWDKKSKGTNHMINLAKKYKLKIKIHLFGDEV